jgi:hypothetical protein
MSPHDHLHRPLTVAALLLASAPLAAAEAPRVRELRTQQVGGITYFHVRLDAPPQMQGPALGTLNVWSDGDLRNLARLPRLIPQDQRARAVYLRLAIPKAPDGAVKVLGDGGLEFVGQWRGGTTLRPAPFLLLYPTAAVSSAPPAWAEVPLTLDFANAQQLPPQAADNLERLWASAQAARFAVLEAQTTGFGFYGFARETTGRKYGVAAPALAVRTETATEYRRLYELTTGTSAILETLQLRRLLGPGPRDQAPRTVPLGKVPGIDIPEHPWEKRLAGRKPVPEPLAKLTPYDNYYVHFKDLTKFLELGDLMDQWGTDLLQFMERGSRDYRVRQRYQQQLCLKDTPLVRQVGPLLIRGMAITGNDAYLREGSDLAFLFQVRDRNAFLRTTELFIQEARRNFAGRVEEKKTDYHGITIESYVTPLREVSLYRAMFEDVVVHANSPVGLRRILDTYQGRSRAITESPDFQYLRSLFPLTEEKDGFLCLPDAYMRQVVGPASKIKQKRRWEALTSLRLVTDGALFTAWETGRLPADDRDLLTAARLRPEEIATPEGQAVRWDGLRRVAVSDVYNTLHFATPLLELPIENVTPEEDREYRQFRQEYMTKWRRYFDPVAIRIQLTDTQFRAETFILPLIADGGYHDLRRFTGGGTTTLDAANIPSTTLAQLLAHIGPQTRRRFASTDALGDWFILRVEDSPLYAKLVELRMRQSLSPEMSDALLPDIERALFQLPIVAGVRFADRQAFDEAMRSISELFFLFIGPVAIEPVKPAHRDVPITRLQFEKTSFAAEALNGARVPVEKRFAPTLYHAHIGDGWYLSPSEALLKEMIDRWCARRDGKEPEQKGEAIAVNSSFYAAPKAAVQARAALDRYLDWESQRRDLTNCAVWYPLFCCGLLPEELSAETMREAAWLHFGFVPATAGGCAYEPRTDEVVSPRHGTLRLPRSAGSTEGSSALELLLEQFRTARADLNFRDEGLHTVVTIERQPLP